MAAETKRCLIQAPEIQQRWGLSDISQEGDPNNHSYNAECMVADALQDTFQERKG